MKYLQIISFLFFTMLFKIGYSQESLDTLKFENSKDTNALFLNNDTLLYKKLDSIKLVIHNQASVLDSLWINELVASSLNDTVRYSLGDEEVYESELKELPTQLLKERLKEIDKSSPFNVEYNPQLEQIIKSYLQKRKAIFSVMMERARFYFPMFEEHLAKYNIPIELKYLAVIESALKPTANSPVGAAGLWQFMYQTGKIYNLNVSSYVDERYDPIRSTEAACKYLSTLYGIYNDWDMALAAYNSGPGNVNKAIRRAGGSTNYWKIRPYLPRETASYVPIFYATMYIFKYSNEHNIKARESAVSRFETDTIHLKRQITFKQINEILSVDSEVVKFLNPQYKLEIVPNIKDKNYALTLPLKDIGNFVSNESLIYAYIDAEEAKRVKELPKYVEVSDRVTYKVKSGDYLGRIAIKYGVSVASIKKWNNLKSTNLKIGQRLVIYPRKA
jgi:membrane-bound lytic murein transglycosylase D